MSTKHDKLFIGGAKFSVRSLNFALVSAVTFNRDDAD